MTETSQPTWLTQEAHDRLKTELARLEGEGRAEITARIAAARDEGDLKENGGYHAAREEQAKQEARIRELKQKLRNVQIGTPPDDGVVEPGMVVTVAFAAGDEEQFLLGSREMADHVEGFTVYSPQSPMGSAISGHSIGDEVEFEGPTGKQIKVTITAATPFKG